MDEYNMTKTAQISDLQAMGGRQVTVWIVSLSEPCR